jgi:hypothetical protein
VASPVLSSDQRQRLEGSDFVLFSALMAVTMTRSPGTALTRTIDGAASSAGFSLVKLPLPAEGTVA